MHRNDFSQAWSLEARTARQGGAARCAARGLLAATLLASLLGCASPMPAPDALQSASGLEEIYILRSLREERTPKSTWCTSERAGFAPFKTEFLLDDRFTFWSVQVRAEDGRVANTRAAKAGDLRTCFGLTTDPKVVNFYAEGHLGELPVAGNGDCLFVRPDFPEKGIATLRCYLNLRGLPSAYVGGLLTTSSLTSGNVIGGETDPAGYTQTSIATIRLWRAR
jgi:hypothetical protein